MLERQVHVLLLIYYIARVCTALHLFGLFWQKEDKIDETRKELNPSATHSITGSKRVLAGAEQGDE